MTKPKDPDLHLNVSGMCCPVPLIRLAASVKTMAVGQVVEIVGNGRLAVDAVIARSSAYAAVLMDIQMPEMDGLEATRRIRAQLGDRRLPIIAMTAHAMDAERQRCFDAGMDDHISKPIDPDQLVRVLNRWIEPGTWTPAALPPPPAVTSAVEADDFPEHLPPFDIAAALIRLNGNRKLLRKLVKGFLETYGNAAGALREMVRLGLLSDAGRLAHTLRGVSGSLEARALFDAARDLEHLCAQKNPDEVAAAIDRLETHLAQALAAAASVADPASPVVLPATPRNVDHDAVLAVAGELGPLLDRNSLSARKRYPALAELMAGGGYDAEMTAMATAMEKLDFAAARRELDALCAKLKTGAGHD